MYQNIVYKELNKCNLHNAPFKIYISLNNGLRNHNQIDSIVLLAANSLYCCASISKKLFCNTISRTCIFCTYYSYSNKIFWTLQLSLTQNRNGVSHLLEFLNIFKIDFLSFPFCSTYTIPHECVHNNVPYRAIF